MKLRRPEDLEEYDRMQATIGQLSIRLVTARFILSEAFSELWKHDEEVAERLETAWADSEILGRSLMKGVFTECESCAAKPGAPVLCRGCLANRMEIERLNRLIERPDSPLVAGIVIEGDRFRLRVI